MPYNGLDLWLPLHSTQISTAGKPLIYMRFDLKAFRCMVCGVFHTVTGPDGLLLQIMGPVKQPAIVNTGEAS